MNPEQLNAIKERAEKATPGPWLVAPEKCGPEGQGVYESDGFGCICEVGDPYPRGNNRPQENMEFIAHAREDVPALVAEVERLRKALSYYADEKHYEPYCIPIQMGDYASDVTEDTGEIARQTLVGESNED